MTFTVYEEPNQGIRKGQEAEELFTRSHGRVQLSMCDLSRLSHEDYHCLKKTNKHRAGEEPSAGKGTCHQAWTSRVLALAPQVGGDHRLLKTVFWPAHIPCRNKYKNIPLQKWATHLLVGVRNLHWRKERCLLICGPRNSPQPARQQLHHQMISQAQKERLLTQPFWYYLLTLSICIPSINQPGIHPTEMHTDTHTS